MDPLGFVQNVLDPRAEFIPLRNAFVSFVFSPRKGDSSSDDEGAPERRGPEKKNHVTADVDAQQTEFLREYQDLIQKPNQPPIISPPKKRPRGDAKGDGKVIGNDDDDAYEEEEYDDEDSQEEEKVYDDLVDFFTPPKFPKKPEEPKSEPVQKMSVAHEEVHFAPQPERLLGLHSALQLFFSATGGTHEALPTTHYLRKDIVDRAPRWILLRLTKLTAARHHKDAVSIAREDLSDLSVPLLHSIAVFLTYVQDSKYEPGYLALHKQTTSGKSARWLEPLLRLVHGFPTDPSSLIDNPIFLTSPHGAAEHAYCTLCGGRQPPTLSRQVQEHAVLPGDTVVSIATKYDVTVASLREANPTWDPRGVLPETAVANVLVSVCVTYSPTCHSPKCGGAMARRPCSMQLGHLMWDIIELDMSYLGTIRRISHIIEDHKTSTRIVNVGDVLLTYDDLDRSDGDFFDEYAKMNEHPEVHKMSSLGLWGAYQEWGIDGLMFGFNVHAHTARYECAVIEVPPMVWAAKYVTDACPSAAGVLTAIQRYAVVDFSIQPVVLRNIMKAMIDEGFMDVTGSEGKKVRKNIKAAIAEPAWLLHALRGPTTTTISFEMPDSAWRKALYLEALLRTPNNNNNDDISAVWNQHRHDIKGALITALKARIHGPLQSHLIDRGRWHVMSAALHRLDEIVGVRGYARNHQGAADEEPIALATFEMNSHGRRDSVMGVFQRDVGSPIYIVVVSPLSAVVWYAKSPPIRQERRSSEAATAQRLEQIRALAATIMDCCGVTASVQIVGLGLTAAALPLYAVLQSIFANRTMFKNDVDIAVEWVPVDVAEYFAMSVAGSVEEFPTWDRDQRVAVSLARRLRDPLSEIARQCNQHNDVIRLPLAVGQEFLQPEDFRRRIDQRLSLWVAAVGVDIRDAMGSGETEAASLLQYLPGLGPVRAPALYAAIAKADEEMMPMDRCTLQGLMTRPDFLPHPMSDDVVRNCIGSMRIRAPDADRDMEVLDPFTAILDGTLIHPDEYASLKPFYDHISMKGPLLRMGMAELTAAVQDARAQYYCDDRCTEFMIDELAHARCPIDMRRGYSGVSAHEYFRAMTGVAWDPSPHPNSDITKTSSSATLRPGELITCTDVRRRGKGLSVRTNFGLLRGFVHMAVPPAQGAELPSTLEAVVESVDLRRLELRLREAPPRMEIPADRSPSESRSPETCHEVIELRYQQQRQARLAAHTTYGHQWFRRDVRSGEEARAILIDKPAGALLVRHSDGNTFVVSFNIDGRHVLHLRVTEERGAEGIGLAVKDEASGDRPLFFQDVDHLSNEYIMPWVRAMREVEKHRKYSGAPRSALNEQLKLESAMAHTIPWYLHVDPDSFKCSFAAANPTKGTNQQYRGKVITWAFRAVSRGWVLFEGAAQMSRHESLDQLEARCKYMLQELVIHMPRS